MKDFNLRFHPTEVELKQFWCLVEWKHDTFLVLWKITRAQFHLRFMPWILSLLLPSAYSIVWNIRWLFCQWKAVCLSRAVEQSVFSNIFSRQRRHPASSFVSCLFSDPSRWGVKDSFPIYTLIPKPSCNRDALAYFWTILLQACNAAKKKKKLWSNVTSVNGHPKLFETWNYLISNWRSEEHCTLHLPK